MITETLIGLLEGVAITVLGWLPGYEFSPVSGLGAALSGSEVLTQWLDLGALIAAIGVVLAAWAFSMGVRSVRMLISHFTGGGGAT